MKPVEFIRDYCGLDLRDFQVEWLEELFREKNGERVNAKSIMGIIALGATYNTVLKVSAQGADEQEAVTAIEQLFESKFQEE